VAESLYRKATSEGPQSVTAAIFWLKTRAGWKESIAHEVSGADGAPIEVREHSNRDLARAVLALLARGIAPDHNDPGALRPALPSPTGKWQ
jgi:hypothetical protein